MPGPEHDQPNTEPATHRTTAERTIRFLDRCRQHLAIVAADDRAKAGTTALTSAVERARTTKPKAFEPTWLPVLDSMAQLADPDSNSASDADPYSESESDAGSPGPTSELVDDLVALAPDLPWAPTHRATDGGTKLALAPLDRVLDLGDTVVGLMYVGPGATYPLHQHPPQELYLTLAGKGRWRYGGNEEFVSVGAGRTLYNHPGDLHSAVAGPLPVVALYVLW